MALSIDLVINDPDDACVTIAGDLDLSSAARLEAVMSALVDSGVRYPLVDATTLDFCDVAGARVLERAHAALRIGGGALTIVAARLPARLFELLWPQLDRDSPNVVRPRAGAAIMPPGPVPAGRHVPSLRRIGRFHPAAPGRGRSASPSLDPPSDPDGGHPSSQRDGPPTIRPELANLLRRTQASRRRSDVLLADARRHATLTCLELASIHTALARWHTMGGAHRTAEAQRTVSFHEAKAVKLRTAAQLLSRPAAGLI